MFHGWFSEKQKQQYINAFHDGGSTIWLDENQNEVEVTFVSDSNKTPSSFNDFVYKGILVKGLRLKFSSCCQE